MDILNRRDGLGNILDNLRQYLNHHLHHGSIIIFLVSLSFLVHSLCFSLTFLLDGISLSFTLSLDTCCLLFQTVADGIRLGILCKCTLFGFILLCLSHAFTLLEFGSSISLYLIFICIGFLLYLGRLQFLSGITAFLGVLMDTEKLSNTTVLKQLGYLKWFLKWAAANKYHNVMDFKSYKPHLVTTQRKVIFLTVDEINQLLAAYIPESRPALERVRDVFVFCCFTGLRHSDAFNLRRSDIKDDCIEITTKKTADSLIIDLNNVSRAILAKYKSCDFPENRALPVISNQKMNDYLEDLCKIAGITKEIRITTYNGGKRTDVVKPKYELITTHAARRSFICNALAAGIPVNVVMKWTGTR